MSPPTSNRLPPYPAYKDSGVEWLERVPAHWEVRRLGQIGVFFKCSGGTKADDVPAGVPCIRYGHLYTQFDHFIERGVSFLSPENVERYSSVECGDVLFAGSGESVDEIGKSAALLLEDGAYAGGDIIAFRSAPGLLTPRFAGYVCECPSSTSQKSAMSRGITIEHIYGHQLKRLAVPIPPLPEQAAIARFLDHADRRIWRYIRAKERLIELVEEQKQAIIHEAVTGRIDVRTGQPYPAYKDSGVKWLGKVPAHWEVRRLGQIGVFFKCSGGTKADDVPAGVPCIRYGHLYTQFDHFIERGVSFLSPENVERYSSVECGDVLFAGSGESVDEIGKSAALLLEDGAYAGGDIIAFRSAPGLLTPRFAGYVCECPSSTSQKSAMSRGITIEHIYGHQLKRLAVPIPPLPEQAAIARLLDAADRRISARRTVVEREIELLREYRTRLIADTVTGKLDVRQAAACLPDGDDEKAPERPSEGLYQ